MWLLPTVGAWPNDRLRVFGNDTIRVGQAALLVPIITVLFIWKQSPGLVKLACLGVVPFSLLVSASSGSRGPFLMLALCGLVIGIRALLLRRWMPGGDPVKVMPLRVVLPILICLFLFLVIPPGTVTRFIPATSVTRLETLTTILSGFANQDLASEAPDHSTGDRLIAYQFAENMFREKPLLGFGTGSYSALLPLKEDRLTWPEESAHPHNLILQVAAEHGITGLLLLALLLGAAVRRVLRLQADPIWNTIGVLFLFFLFCSMVSTEMIDNRTLWGLVVLSLMAPDPPVLRRFAGSRLP
jgi:O-antigen ligase